jgi:hypothetical protein
MVDLLKRVEQTLQNGMTQVVNYTGQAFDIVGFEIEVSFIGRDEVGKLYEKFTKKKYSKKTKKLEDVTDRDGLLESWADRVIKNWSGLTLGKVSRLIPIKLTADDDPESVVVCNHDNRIALLKHNADFETFVIDVATDPEPFTEMKKQADKEAENLRA